MYTLVFVTLIGGCIVQAQTTTSTSATSSLIKPTTETIVPTTGPSAPMDHINEDDDAALDKLINDPTDVTEGPNAQAIINTDPEGDVHEPNVRTITNNHDNETVEIHMI